MPLETELNRRSGILLHVTALPGRFGIGDLGPGADRFLGWLADAGQSVWQVLPIGPSGFYGSPYDSASALAGNRYLISPEQLEAQGWIPEGELAKAPEKEFFDDEQRSREWRDRILARAWECFNRSAAPDRVRRFHLWRDDPRQTSWLSDWALFATLKQKLGAVTWRAWPVNFALREPEALANARRSLRPEIAFEEFVQYLFFSQWRRVRQVGRRLKISILGDVAIYVANDSADVWSHRDLFDLDADGRSLRVAGVPPDYFSDTGQRWGNPLYRWDRLEETGYSWWIERMRHAFSIFDIVRLDHFRGFESYWAVPASESTATSGTWQPGPGRKLFDAIERALGKLPIIAEDLGIITPEVTRLRKELNFPGMKVLQFGFSEVGSPHHPQRLEPGDVVYTGTHDNDTTRGWFETAGPEERRLALETLGWDGEEIVRSLIAAALASPASLSIIPMQDVLELGSAARFNRPGESRGSWRWRLRPEDLDASRAERLRLLVESTGRLP